MNKIINILQEQKSIPLDQFINVALYDKKFGYYMKKNPFGRGGDYITSPLISKLFSEMISVWCVAFWEHLGKPKKIILIEMGPGDGSLCKDLIETLKNFKEFYKCVEIKLLEKSHELKKIQKNKIKSKKVKWIKKINNINSGPIIFLANEFFDSLPIKQVYKKKNEYFEKHVVFMKNKKKLDFIYKKASKILIKKIKKYNLDSTRNIIEFPNAGIDYLKIISKKINKFNGSLLSFDYGYYEKNVFNTLQAIKNHKYINILKIPGEADITHHINYKLFEEILRKNKLVVEKTTSQAEFLQKLGIIERANILSQNVSFKKKIDMFYRLKRLLNHKEMGSLFKVLFAKKEKTKFSLGF